MWPFEKNTRSGRMGGVTSLAILALAALATILFPSAVLAQATPTSVWQFFGDGVGDPYSSVFLNQLFGPLFPSASRSGATSIFAEIIAYFNVIVLLIGGLMFFYNVTVGVMQSAHEGQVLGQRWSSLWAPLRLILAVGMLVPVNNGYNLAQSGVAYVVQGSTKMASAVWATTASAVISDDIPLAAPVTRFDTAVMSDLYEQAACMTALDAQVKIANPAASVGYVEVVSDAKNGNRYTYQSAINNGSEWVDHGVCGSWSTPRTPQYLDNIIAGISDKQVEDAMISSSLARQMLDTFRNGHRDIMLDVAGDMRQITDTRYTQMMASDVAPPSIAGEIAASHKDATAQLDTLINTIRDQATSSSIGVSRPRDSLLNRITGSGACFNDDGSHNASSDRAASVACYGEGWMGAGSWYILMAKINNELSTLTSARPSTVSPTYSSAIVWPSEAEIYRNAGGQGSGWFGMVRSRDTAGMPSVEQSIKAMEKYQALFESSAMELAALGFQIPTHILTDINSDSPSNPDSFWDEVVGTRLEAFTRATMDFFDPGNGGRDPMIGLIGLGHLLINIGSGILLVTAATGFFTGGGAAVALLPVYSVLLASGVSLIFILPIMPFLYWILAISGYFLLITEAVIAVNLWALSHLRMDGEGLSGEAGRQGWLMLLSLFMTPTLMVFGFIIGMAIFRIVSDLISAGLFYAVSGIMGSNPVIWLFGTVGYTILIVTAYGLLLERSFSLVSEFPNRVMRWMGSSVEIGGGEGRIQAAVGAAALGVNHIGNGLEKGMGPIGQDGKFIKGRGFAGWLRQKGERRMPGKGITRQ